MIFTFISSVNRSRILVFDRVWTNLSFLSGKRTLIRAYPLDPRGKSRAPRCLGMELTIIENERVHYLGRGKFAHPNPTTVPKEKHGISSYNLNKRVIHKGGGDGGARNSISELEKARKGNKLTVMDGWMDV